MNYHGWLKKNEIDFCHKSKKYRTKYFSALKELFAVAKEGEANEIKEDCEGAERQGLQAQGSDSDRTV